MAEFISLLLNSSETKNILTKFVESTVKEIADDDTMDKSKDVNKSNGVKSTRLLLVLSVLIMNF
jgi:hypothetical protein